MVALQHNSLGHVRYVIKDGLKYFPLYGFYFKQVSLLGINMKKICVPVYHRGLEWLCLKYMKLIFHSIHTRVSDHLQSFDGILVVLRHGKSCIFSMIVYLLEEGILVKNPWRNRWRGLQRERNWWVVCDYQARKQEIIWNEGSSNILWCYLHLF